jgi:hypothetical protein
MARVLRRVHVSWKVSAGPVPLDPLCPPKAKLACRRPVFSMLGSGFSSGILRVLILNERCENVERVS